MDKQRAIENDVYNPSITVQYCEISWHWITFSLKKSKVYRKEDPQNYSFRHHLIKKLSTTVNKNIPPRSFSLTLYGKQQARESMQSFPYPNLKMKCFAARFSFVLLPSFSFPPSLCRFEPQCLFWFYCAYKNLRSIFSIFEKHQNIDINIRMRFSRNLGMLSGESKKYFLPWSQRTGRLSLARTAKFSSSRKFLALNYSFHIILLRYFGGITSVIR